MGKWDKFEKGTELVERIWNSAKELLGDRAKEELLDENSGNVFKLTSEDRTHVIIEEDRFGYVKFKFYDSNGSELFIARASYDHSGNIEQLTGFECEKKEKLLEYIDSFENTEFDNIKLLYCNYRLNDIRGYTKDYLGIDEKEFSFKDPCYTCLKSRDSDILSVIVNNKYHITTAVFDGHNGSLNPYWEYNIVGKDIGLYIRQKRMFVEKFNLEIRLDFWTKLKINKNGYDFEFYYDDNQGSRKIKISLNDMYGLSSYKNLESIFVGETTGTIKTPVLGINYDNAEKLSEPEEQPNIDIFNEPSDNHIIKRYYNVYIRGSKSETTLDYTNFSFLLLHPEIRDFIVFILNVINVKYSNTNMIERITKTECFGVLLDYILKTRDEYPYDEKVNSIFDSIEYYQSSTMYIVRRVKLILQSEIGDSEKEAMINNLCNGMTPSTIEQIKECINWYNKKNTGNKKLELKL